MLPSKGVDIDASNIIMMTTSAKVVPEVGVATPEKFFRRKCTGGVVKLRVVGAKDLAVMDKNLFSKGGSSDPYVQVELHSSLEQQGIRIVGKTDVVKKSVNPVFRKSTFSFSIDEATFDLACSGISEGNAVELLFKIFDQDMLSSDDQMGESRVMLRDIFIDSQNDATTTPHNEIIEGFQYKNEQLEVKECESFKNAQGTLDVWAALEATFKEIEDEDRNRTAQAEAMAAKEAALAAQNAAKIQKKAQEAELKQMQSEEKMSQLAEKAAAAAAFQELQKRWLAKLKVHGVGILRDTEIELVNDREFILAAADIDGRALDYATDALLMKFKGDEKFMEGLREKWAEKFSDSEARKILRTSPILLRNDQEFIICACELDVESFAFAHPDLQSILQSDMHFISNMRVWLKNQWLVKVKKNGTKMLQMAPPQLLSDAGFLIEVRGILAQRHLNLEPEQQQALKYAKYDGMEVYFGSLNAALADGSTALLHANYLIGLNEADKVLPQRRELPSEAFYTGPVWEKVLIIAISYTWATNDHPDPDGLLLSKLAIFFRGLMKTDQKREKIVAVFWDWGSLYQELPQAPRSDDENEAFEISLKNVDLWFGHPSVITLQMKEAPPQRLSVYSNSLWPVFESTLSWLIKCKDDILDGEKVLKWLLSTSVSESKEICWLGFVDAGAKDNQRPLPKAPVEFNNAIQGLHSSTQSDFQLLRNIYSETFRSVIHNAKSFRFKTMPWVSIEEWKAFVKYVLPKCHDLEELYLMDNDNLECNIKDICFACTTNIRSLYLDNTHVGGEVSEAQWEKFKRLERVHMKNTKIEGNIQEFVKQLPETLQEVCLKRTAISGDIGSAFWSALDLKYLDLNYTRVSGNIINAVEALPSTLQALHLKSTACFGDCGGAQWKKLVDLGWLDLSKTNVDGTLEGLWAAGISKQCKVEITKQVTRRMKYGAWKEAHIKSSDDSSRTSYASSEGPGKLDRPRRVAFDT